MDKKAMKKRDGHTHTHFCMHGSGEDTEEFVIRAIELGFETYSFTEHLPLPERFLKSLSFTAEDEDSYRIKDNDTDAYIKEMHRLKKKYQDRIQLLVGFEVDYLPEEYAFHTKEYLGEYGEYLDDGLISLHFMPGAGGWCAVDRYIEDFDMNILGRYGSFEEFQLAYFRTVGEILTADLGEFKPKRIGHLTLCNKFQTHFNPDGILGEKVKNKVREILARIRSEGFELDVNTAGLYKPQCREIYPAPWIIELAKEQGIPLVYGSDSHAVEDVGRGYEEYRKELDKA